MLAPRQLKERVSGARNLTDSTLKVWCFALNYIFEHGWADITDMHFVRSGTKEFGISSQSLIRHLRRMSKLGLIHAHKMVEHHEFLNGYVDDHKAPRLFTRYTMPGMHSQLYDCRSEGLKLGRRGHDLTALERVCWERKFATLSKPNKGRQAPASPSPAT